MSAVFANPVILVPETANLPARRFFRMLFQPPRQETMVFEQTRVDALFSRSFSGGPKEVHDGPPCGTGVVNSSDIFSEFGWD